MRRLSILEDCQDSSSFLVDYDRDSNALTFSGEINFRSAHDLCKWLRWLEWDKQGLSDRTLNFYLTSDGGEVTHALKIHDALTRSPLTIIVTVEGLVASAATLLLCAVPSVKITPHSFLLLHEIRSYFADTHSNNQRQLAHSEELMSLIVDIYNRRFKTSIDKDAIVKDWFINAQQAVNLGLADEIMR
jgi:ATP-dependent protease ClpP protease subunit